MGFCLLKGCFFNGIMGEFHFAEWKRRGSKYLGRISGLCQIPVTGVPDGGAGASTVGPTDYRYRCQ